MLEYFDSNKNANIEIYNNKMKKINELNFYLTEIVRKYQWKKTIKIILNT